MAPNFDIAPPAKTVDGLQAVPIDISSIGAALTFDGATSGGVGDATITYTVGPTAGNPIFDLRQTITAAWLDGVPFPPAQLAHHPFGSGSFTDLRVIESVQAAGSVHTLRLQYTLSLPDAQMGGAYLPKLEWSAGPRLQFVFGLSDLNRCRYAEAWLPANLIFDQFSIDLELQVLNTAVSHSVITNGIATSAGTNHWQIAFPARFTALSPMLEVRAADTLEQSTGSVALPVSGRTVTIEAWKPAGAATDLAGQIAQIAGHLTDNENDYGPYLHDERFVAFFNGGGMEYEGGTTTGAGALEHETFHSWYARGIKPASQADGWWDEGFTRFHDDGADDATAFDFTAPPVLLCSRDPWQRHTVGNAYADGSAFFRGLASLLGVATLNNLMGDLYRAQRGAKPVSTARMEEFLLSRSGNAQVVPAFHRFAFGLPDPSPAPDLWIRDAPGDPGADLTGDPFWDSPDVWIRTADDGGTTHQSPEAGQDNWFHARVRNKAGAGAAAHFVVTFQARGFAGTEFVYPGDFLPADAAKAEFDLGPGETRIVKARWPRHLVPAAGSHTCVLVAVLTRSDMPTPGRHVWEHNNLAQKNLTVVDLEPNSWLVIPVVISNWSGVRDGLFDLEIMGSRESDFGVSLVHASKKVLEASGLPVHRLPDERDGRRPVPSEEVLDCGGRVPAGGRHRRLLTSDAPDVVSRRFPGSWELPFPRGSAPRLPVTIPPFTQVVFGLKIAAPDGAEPGRSSKLHLVQRRRDTKQAVGGVAVAVGVSGKR